MTWPEAPIYVWGIFPVKAKWLVAFLFVVTFSSAFGGAAGGVAHFAHLGGFITGFLYLKTDWKAAGQLQKMGRAARARRFAIVARDPALRLLDVADEIVAYTLFTPTDRLRRQFKQGELGRKKIKDRTLRVKKLYESSDRIRDVYDRWLSFLSERDVRNRIVSYENDEVTFLDDIP